jgi:hypothetical protein
MRITYLSTTIKIAQIVIICLYRALSFIRNYPTGVSKLELGLLAESAYAICYLAGVLSDKNKSQLKCQKRVK